MEVLITQYGIWLFASLVGMAVLIFFVALWSLLSKSSSVGDRLAEYGGEIPDQVVVEPDVKKPRMAGANRFLAGRTFGKRLSGALARADVPMTTAEFAAIILGIMVVVFLLGLLRGGLIVALPMALVAGVLPTFYLRSRENKRRKAFTQQIPDILTLMVGALRTGYGLTQSMDVLTTQMTPPASSEFSRVLRAVSLGVPVQRALTVMAERIGSDDLRMMVTAINVQYETGGNLAQTLETIGETVQERIRIKREIQVLTSQQTLSSIVIALLPLAVGGLIFVINPGYIGQIFTPKWIWLPATAVFLELVGLMALRRIVKIEV